MSKKRVVVEFDEHSLKTLEQMKELGLVTEDGTPIIHHHTPFPVSEEEYRRRINSLSHELQLKDARIRELELENEELREKLSRT